MIGSKPGCMTRWAAVAHRVAKLVALVTSVLVGCTGAPTAPSSPPDQIGSTSVKVTRNLPLGQSIQIAGLTVGAGAVWIASPASAPYRPGTSPAGRLLRIDVKTGTPLPARPTAGDPVGIAVAGPDYWVAGGSGDRSIALADANMVVQSDIAGGRVSYRYPIASPRALAAGNDSAWVLSGGVGATPTTLLRLRGGQATRVASVAGQAASNPGFSGDAVAACLDSIYVATSDSVSRMTTISQVTTASGETKQILTVPGTGGASLACSQGDGVFVTIKDPAIRGVYRVAPAADRQAFGPRSVSDLAVVSGRLWVIDQAYGEKVGHVSVFDTSTEVRLATMALPPGDARLITADPETGAAWAIVGDRLLELRANK